MKNALKRAGAWPALSLVLIGLVLGLWGIQWGLPSQERVRRILPPGLDNPAFHQSLSEAWVRLHRDLGENLVTNPESSWVFSGSRHLPAGWSEPPDLLVHSVRSFYLRSAHDDEQTFLLILSRMKPKKLDFHPHMFVYGTAHIYTLGAWLAAGAASGLVELHKSLLPYMAEPSRMASMYLTGRLLSVASYVGSALVLLLIGMRHMRPSVGWLAGLLFLLSPAAIVQAHILKAPSFWAFFALLAVERSLAALESGRRRDYALAGAVCGVVVGTSLGGWPVCLVVAAVAALRMWAPSGTRSRPVEELKGLALAAAAAIAVFFLTNPYWILDHEQALRELRVVSSVNAGLGLDHPLLMLIHPMRHALTIPLLLLAALGAGRVVLDWKREKALLLCLCALGIGLAASITFQSVETARSMRFYLVWMGMAGLLASHAILAPGRWRVARLTVGVLAALNLGCEAVAYTHNFGLAASTRSNQYLAGDWIEANVPEGSSIGLIRLPAPSNAPYFRYDRYDLWLIRDNVFRDLPRKQLPSYMVVTIPDYDDRPGLQPNLSLYENVASFGRPRIFPWVRIHPTSTTANPVIEVYRLKLHSR